MIFVAVAVVISTTLGVLARRRYGDAAERATDRGLQLFVWFVLPPLTYFVVANLKIDSGVGLGIGMTYLILAVVALTAYTVSARVLALDRPSVGATVNASLLANTGYLGIPLSAALLGHDAIGSAVAYDSAVTATVFWTVGFAVGAAFGTKVPDTARDRVKAFFTRNPVFFAAVLGALAPHALAPQAATDVAKTCFSLILPIGFFLLGVHLMGEREDGTLEFPPPLSEPVLLALALRIVVAPGLLLTSTLLIDMPSAYLLQAAMPTGVLSVLVAHIYGLNLRLTASAVAWTTTIVMIVALAAGTIT